MGIVDENKPRRREGLLPSNLKPSKSHKKKSSPARKISKKKPSQKTSSSSSSSEAEFWKKKYETISEQAEALRAASEEELGKMVSWMDSQQKSLEAFQTMTGIELEYKGEEGVFRLHSRGGVSGRRAQGLLTLDLKSESIDWDPEEEKCSSSLPSFLKESIYFPPNQAPMFLTKLLAAVNRK